MGRRQGDASVGLAAYQMDSHSCQRVVVDGRLTNEGCVEVSVPAPYPIPYASIVPRAGECENLVVPVCLSASHIAYGSIRMEPVFMALAQSGAIAIGIARGRECPLQEVPPARLQAALAAAGQVTQWIPPAVEPRHDWPARVLI